MPSLWEIKIYSCANDYWSTMHTSSCIENMDKLVNYSIWTLSHHCFQGFYTNLRVSIENLIYTILVGNQNIFMCEWLLFYIVYFILYREYGSSPMIASKVFFQIDESQEITSSVSSLCEIKIYSCANHY